MRQPKHTPGPEDVMAYFDLSEEHWDALPSDVIAKLTSVYMKDAAAPAMYKALRNLLEVYQDSTDDDGSPAVLSAIDALAQAEGKLL